jgi:hypothetical protein
VRVGLSGLYKSKALVQMMRTVLAQNLQPHRQTFPDSIRENLPHQRRAQSLILKRGIDQNLRQKNMV